MWILEPDIKGYFENISHDYLVNALQNFPAKELIRRWLKAEILDGDLVEKSTGSEAAHRVESSSPLLFNIALLPKGEGSGMK